MRIVMIMMLIIVIIMMMLILCKYCVNYIHSGIDTPYIALTGELWGAYCEDFRSKGARYNGTALYIKPTNCVNDRNTSNDIDSIAGASLTSNYSKTSSRRRFKYQPFDSSRLVLQLCLPNTLNQVSRMSRMKMKLEQHRQAMLQHLCDQQVYHLLKCY